MINILLALGKAGGVDKSPAPGPLADEVLLWGSHIRLAAHCLQYIKGLGTFRHQRALLAGRTFHQKAALRSQ